MHASKSGANNSKDVGIPPSLDLVPSIEDDLVMYSVTLVASAMSSLPVSTLHEQADEVLNKWLKHTVQWVRVAIGQAPDSKLTAEDFTRLLLRLQGLCKHVDVCKWFRETGSPVFLSVAALARVWLGRSPSNAYQERVFSTGAFVMSSLSIRTDNRRAKMQVLLKHNRSDVRRWKWRVSTVKGKMVWATHDRRSWS
ncbi:hypothetical protein PInf_006969 [Phytophthora infestans]|nr:hypothetical protein PInf_006969 [Phytophthora infestans]